MIFSHHHHHHYQQQQMKHSKTTRDAITASIVSICRQQSVKNMITVTSSQLLSHNQVDLQFLLISVVFVQDNSSTRQSNSTMRQQQQQQDLVSESANFYNNLPSYQQILEGQKHIQSVLNSQQQSIIIPPTMSHLDHHHHHHNHHHNGVYQNQHLVSSHQYMPVHHLQLTSEQAELLEKYSVAVAVAQNSQEFTEQSGSLLSVNIGFVVILHPETEKNDKNFVQIQVCYTEFRIYIPVTKMEAGVG
jgi:hypothetical protein